MTDTVLKFRSEPEGSAGVRKASLVRVLRERVRLVLLVIVPLLGLVGGLVFYLAGGRTVSTDNAYVGAQKVLVTPDVSGKIASVRVKEGERVAAGDVLFDIDPTPFRLALSQAQSKLDSARTDFNNMKSNLKSLDRLV
jgi:membrane fusion protein (multidrug efflux system)